MVQGMRILVGLWHADGYAGTQSWSYTVARQLRAMGHDVAFYAGGRGQFAARMMGDGFPCYAHRLGERPTADLAIISQPRMFNVCRICGANPLMENDPPTLPAHINAFTGQKCIGSQTEAVSLLPPCDRIYVMHGWLPHDAPVLDGSPYVTISRETHKKMLGRGIQTTRVEQPIDLDRFAPREPLRDEPVAAVLSTWPADPGAIEKACEEAGVKLYERTGGVWDTPGMLNSVDILIGTGRGVAEAMACGRAAVICGKFGCDGMVCADLWGAQLGCNLSGRATMADPAESLVSALKQYDPAIGGWARDTAVQTFDPLAVAEKIMGIVQ